ncbi:acyl-CoA carboxylase subunit epsilon [Kitasatospora sp. NBC_01266]|uniref:acyl-CoA carboxylase subunit epsilon n=1 Tax=Kitasatospora sp. NBC_01266 TaxID=2903572 RepID=UPI002E35E595|nr:acyl-CoA carboxylase subunit epsilon [Kitasatospora sp. NBC_01266]
MLTLQVLHGNPTPDELAALTAVLMARVAQAAHPAAAAPARSASHTPPRRRTSWRMAGAYRPPAAWASVG